MAKHQDDTDPKVPGPDTAEEPNYGSALSKLSVATMRCDPEAAKREMKECLLCRIMGRADGIKWKKAANDELVAALIGQFVGANAQTGEVYESGVAYLPPGVHDMVAAALVKEAEKPEEERQAISVEFAFEIYSFPASNPRGYSYRCKNLVAPVAKDPLAEFRRLLPAKAKALTAPASRD